MPSLACAKTSGPKMERKSCIKFLFNSWSEFRISARKRRQYGILFIKHIYKVLNEATMTLDFTVMTEDEFYSFRHIVEAMDVKDLKK